jgi:hypothetical protein
MSTLITCPECSARLKLPQKLQPGTSLICPECSQAIRVPDTKITESPRPMTVVNKKRSRRPDDDEEGIVEDAEPVRTKSKGPKRAEKKGLSSAALILLAGGAVLVILVLVGGGVVLAISLSRSKSAKPPQQPPFVLLPGPVADRPPQEEVQAPPRITRRPAIDDPPDRDPPPPIKQPDPPPPVPEPPRPPRSLDWAVLNVASLSVGDVAARSALDLEALRYLPPQSETVIGVDVKSLGSKLALAWLMQKITVLGEECPIDVLERDTRLQLNDLDHIVIAGKIDFTQQYWLLNKPFPVEATTYVVKTKTPVDRGGLMQKIKAGPAKRFRDKEYFPLPEARKGKIAHLYMPADNIVVFSLLPEAQLTTILALDGAKPALAPESLAALKALEQSHAWMVMPPAQLRAHLPSGAALVANLQPGIDAAASARAVGVSLRIQGEQVKFGLAFATADPGAGKALTVTLQEFWNKHGKSGIQNIAGRMAPGFQPVLNELAQGLQWKNQNECAVAIAPISFKALDDLLKSAE